MASDRGKSFDPGETFGDTIGPTRGVGLGGELATPEFPTLTLLHHPDLERVGERCVLAPLRGASRATVVSRTEPEFVCPRGGPRRALNDGRISRRRPLRIDWRADGGVDLYAEADGPAVEVDGVPLRGLESYSAQRVTQGLVVMMAERVVLLVHATDGLAAESLGHGMVGESDAVQQVRRHVSRYAGETQIGILVRGESGTGKELVARALHEAGPRAGRPFVAVNMGAVTRSLASAELFGSVRGAFNDARDHGGYVGAAERGTLFLDEIGETPSEVQPLLLRFLQDGTYERVGSSATRQADVRIVTATDAPLEDAVASGQFRRAL